MSQLRSPLDLAREIQKVYDTHGVAVPPEQTAGIQRDVLRLISEFGVETYELGVREGGSTSPPNDSVATL